MTTTTASTPAGVPSETSDSNVSLDAAALKPKRLRKATRDAIDHARREGYAMGQRDRQDEGNGVIGWAIALIIGFAAGIGATRAWPF